MSSKRPEIAPTATIGNRVKLGSGCIIGRRVDIASDVIIGSDTIVKTETRIGDCSIIDANVLIGPRVLINSGALILKNAVICPNKVKCHSSDARYLYEGVTIGEGVHLHDEVELAHNAIIPNQSTIACLGNLGTKNRVVTIYGSDEGPRYSIGCQLGIFYPKVRERVMASEVTTEQSADTYKPFLPTLQEVGKAVQKNYQQAQNHVEELKAMRECLDLQVRY